MKTSIVRNRYGTIEEYKLNSLGCTPKIILSFFYHIMMADVNEESPKYLGITDNNPLTLLRK